MSTEKKKIRVHEEKQNPNHIPFDLLTTEILTRLPPKSLFRFKTVCKQWLSTISTPEFISLHVERSKTTHYSSHNPGVLIETNATKKSACSYLSYDYNVYKNHTLHIKRNVYLVPFSNNVVYRVMGSCNGLICLWLCSSENICFWNPVTRECRMIRMPSKAVYFHHGLWGLGYIQASDDYKLVNIRLRIFGHTKRFVVSAYTLRTNKWNRYVSYSPLANDVTQDSKEDHLIFGININNVIAHWLVAKKHADGSIKRFILAFDMVNESFSDVLLPQRLYDHDMRHHAPFCLSNNKDNICVIVKNNQASWFCGRPRLVWELKCYGDWLSWKKIFNFTALGYTDKYASELRTEGLDTPKKGFQYLMFLMNSEAWLVCRGDRKKRRYILDGFDSARQVCSHVETFVSPFIGENLDHPTGKDI